MVEVQPEDEQAALIAGVGFAVLTVDLQLQCRKRRWKIQQSIGVPSFLAWQVDIISLDGLDDDGDGGTVVNGNEAVVVADDGEKVVGDDDDAPPLL